ncbi:MAG TPA: hypothetical protein VJH70_01745 [Candidatus Paceibacterota bacterium]
MILVTHGIVGGAIGRFLPTHPILAFALGFLSHFVIDAIPHWHYPLTSIEEDTQNPLNNDLPVTKKAIRDFFAIGVDCLSGILIALYFLKGDFSMDTAFISIVAGALGGIVPDALQFVYWKWRREPLVSLQKFHLYIHSKMNIDDQYLVGITTQTTFAILVIWITNILT